MKVGLDAHGWLRTSDAGLVLWGCGWVIFSWVGKTISNCVVLGKEVWKMSSRNLCVSSLGDELLYSR